MRQSAFNSSHYVWLLTDLSYFESSQGLLFAYAVERGTLFVALEPLPRPASAIDAGDLGNALAELEAQTATDTSVFVGIYEPCMRVLADLGFRGLRVGSDPFVALEKGGPKGNKAKGIRSARNQALRHGLEIEEWALGALAHDQDRRSEVSRVHALWSDTNLFRLSGFLLAADPLADIEGRRLFVARAGGELVGLLVTSPVRFGQSSYFEDLMYTPTAPNGTTELLTLHAMEALRIDGQVEVSLGVVALNNLGFFDPVHEGAIAKYSLRVAKIFAKLFYNSEGIELNRKRYQPRRWADTFLACRVREGDVDWLVWTTVFVKIIIMLQPRLKIRPAQAYRAVMRWAYKQGLHFASGAGICLLAWQAAYPTLPAIFAVSLGIGSGVLVRSRIHGWALTVTYAVGFGLAELLRMHAVIDIFNRGNVTRLPGSLSLAAFWPGLYATGVAIHFIGRKRGTWLGLIALLIPLGFGMSAGHPEILGERLFPIFFLLAGYVAGRINFAVYRRQSEAQSKNKPPVSPKGTSKISA